MKRTVVVFALMSLTVIALFVANQTLLLAKPPVAATETMHTANKLYESGQYVQAAQGYQQLADQGFADSALYYNLGNAYFKQGDYGQAILNYRRAEQLAPRDADIQTNLNLGRTKVVDQFEENVEETAAVNEDFVSRLGKATQAWLTLNELAMITLGVWFLFSVLVIVISNLTKGSSLREALQYVLVATSLVLTIGIVSLGSRTYVEHNNPEGVIVAGEIVVTSGPGSQYVTEFSLHSGTEVSLVEQRQNWVRLAVPDSELQGWVPANAVAKIGG
jgi:hypothetical protein